jgi:hypothetical protein
MVMRQSTKSRRVRQPVWLLLLLGVTLIPAKLTGQARYRVTREENFRRDPGPNERLLASVASGVELVGHATQNGWVQVTVEGWVWGRSLRRLGTDSDLAYEVTPASGENLRDAPNGTVVARLRRGFQADEVERRGDWVRVRRLGWIFGRSLERVSGRVTETPAPADPPADGQASDRSRSGVGLDYAVTAGDTPGGREPGDTTVVLKSGAPVRIVTRSGEWVKVQTEVWVRAEDLRPGTNGVLVGVSGAEVRARPKDFEGEVVQWRVQYIALKTADDLRPEISAGQQYMLCRGPLPEAGFVYVALSPEQVRQVERFTNLTEIVILGRIKVGRTRFLGNPVVDLIEMDPVQQPTQ